MRAGVAVLFMAFVVACTGDPGGSFDAAGSAGRGDAGTGAGGQGGMAAQGGAGGAGGATCAVAGRVFLSMIPMECGRGPDGGVQCRWRVSFTTTGTFAWQYSDVAETGTYTCSGSTVTGQRLGGSSTINGQYAAASDTLVWNGVTYEGQ